MIKFEKALKSGARLYAKDVNIKGTKFDESKTYADYSMGARWAREFTVREICEFIEGDGTSTRNSLLVRSIKSHFTTKSTEDGGVK